MRLNRYLNFTNRLYNLSLLLNCFLSLFTSHPLYFPFLLLNFFLSYVLLSFYWIVQKVRADFEGKLKRRRFKFLISFINFIYSLPHQSFRLESILLSTRYYIIRYIDIILLSLNI